MSSHFITIGSLVEFTYFITDQHNNLLENITHPVSYIHGHHSGIFPALEEQLAGHQEDDEVIISLTPKQAFGEVQNELIFSDNIDNVPEQYRHIGAEVEMQSDDGEKKAFIVSEITDTSLTVDGNHPFAGLHLTFNITIKSVRQATNDELSGIIPTGLAASQQKQNIMPTLDKNKLN